MARTKKVITRKPIRSLEEAVESTYSASDLSELFGINRGQIQSWTKRELLNPSGGGGHGLHKEFSLWDLLCAYIAKDLSKFMTIGNLAQTLKQIEFSFIDEKTKYFEIYDVSKPVTFCVTWSYTEDGGTFIQVRKNGYDSNLSDKRPLILNITRYFQEVLIRLYFLKNDILPEDWLKFKLTPGKMPKES